MLSNEKEEQILQDAISYITNVFEGESSGHDVYHTLRVYQNAKLLLQEEKEADSFLVLLGALLHDVDDYKLFKDHVNYENARSFITAKDIDKETQEKIIHIIEQVSFKGKDSVIPDTIEGRIVQDSDRLDALGAIGIARAFAYGGKNGRPLYDPNTDDKEASLPDETTYKERKGSTISHFYEKLLHLKDMMTTESGKRLALKRHQVMVDFLNTFYDEINGIA